MRKITFLALHLGYGGIEKAICDQANILCENNEVEILSTYKLYDKPAFFLKPQVKVTYLLNDLKPNKDNLLHSIRNKKLLRMLREASISLRVLFLRKNRMKRAIRHLNSDVIISTRFLYNRMLTKNRPKNTVTIAQEHSHHNDNQKYVRELVSSVKNMDYFMPVSSELTQYYRQELSGTNVKCVYISHSLDYWPEDSARCKNKTIISVGRLSAEKGFLDLIEVFSKIAHTHEDWCLNIIGDGDQMPLLKNKIVSYGLQEKVLLHGYQNKEYINEMLQKSSIYLMTSFEESFGIVLIEAQSFGLPCVAFDSAQGAREIIADGENGYLIAGRDFGLFEKAVNSLIANGDLRTTLGRKGRENALKYKEDCVAQQWRSFLNSISKATTTKRHINSRTS